MLKKLWNNMEEYLLVYSLMLSVGLVFIQVVMRYVFSNSLSWSEELARYLFLWQIWVGASYAVKEHRHLRIELIQDFIHDPSEKKCLNYLRCHCGSDLACFWHLKAVLLLPCFSREGRFHRQCVSLWPMHMHQYLLDAH